MEFSIKLLSFADFYVQQNHDPLRGQYHWIGGSISPEYPHNPTEYLFLDQKRKLGIVKRIQKQITKFELKPTDFCFVTN